MSTVSICNSQDSSRSPDANKVALRFMDFVGAAFEYYSKTEPSKDANEVFGKIVTYMNSLTDELRVHCQKSQSNSKDAQKPKEEKYAPKELVQSASPPNSDTTEDNDCRICLDPVGERHFGMLEQCDHKYCEPCMRTLVRGTTNQSIKCPTCRIKSHKVIYRSRFVPSGLEKMAEFDSMQCCATHGPEVDEDQQDTEQGMMTVDDSESDGEQMLLSPDMIIWLREIFSTSTESSTDTETETDTESDTDTNTDTELIMDWSEMSSDSSDSDSDALS